jgi:site-specific recombinase XerD
VASGLGLWHSGLSTDQQRLIRTTAQGWSANSRRAFLGAVHIWADWCAHRGIPVLVATGQDAARFVRELAGLAPRPGPQAWWPAPRRIASLEAYLVHIRTAYRLLGHDSPTLHDQVRADMKVARKQLGVKQRQSVGLRYKGEVAELSDPALGISIVNLLKACGPDWQGLRDAALLQVAYDTACRSSELVAMRIEQLSFDADGSGTVDIPRAKTDQEAQGSYRYLSAASCTAIRRWTDRGKLGGYGPLFRPVKLDFDGAPIAIPGRALHVNSVLPILRTIVKRAQTMGVLGLTDGEVRDWLKRAGSHSFRVGKLQEHIAAGDELGAICQSYNIKDVRTVLRYGARLATKSGAAARLAQKIKGDECEQ